MNRELLPLPMPAHSLSSPIISKQSRCENSCPIKRLQKRFVRYFLTLKNADRTVPHSIDGSWLGKKIAKSTCFPVSIYTGSIMGSNNTNNSKCTNSAILVKFILRKKNIRNRLRAHLARLDLARHTEAFTVVYHTTKHRRGAPSLPTPLDGSAGS